ncbi:MAG: hypothetical protein JNM84_15795 [Planctomycetes bacterium]|nr:hypothetical protein [Planctomycetota bacterium]
MRRLLRSNSLSALSRGLTLGLALAGLAAPLAAQGSVRQLSLQLYPGSHLDVETGIVLSVERFGDARADLALKGLAIPGKVAPDGMLQLEPLGGAKLARLPLGTRAEVEKLFTLPIDGLRAEAEALGSGGGFVLHSAEGHFARLWLRALPTGAVELRAVIEDAGVPRFAPPPADFRLELDGATRRLRWSAGGRKHLLRRTPFGLAGDDLAPEAGAFELELEGEAHLDASADPQRCYRYELAPVLDGGKRGLAAEVLALPIASSAGEPWRATIGNGGELDLYEARAAGRNVHLRVIQIYDSGLQIEPGSGGGIVDARFAAANEGALVVGEDGFAIQQIFLQADGEAVVRTAEGLLGRVKLLRLGNKGRNVFEAELELELAPPGALGFLRAPQAPRLEWKNGRVVAEWKHVHAASELGRRFHGGAIERMPCSPDALRFEDTPPPGQLSAEYLVRAFDREGRRSPWSAPSAILLVDPQDGPRLYALVEESVRALASEDDEVRSEGERRLRLLGSLAQGALQKLADAGGAAGEAAESLLREMDGEEGTADADADPSGAQARLQLELQGLSAELRAVALAERRGERLYEALLGGAHGDPADPERAALRRALASGDSDGLLRRALDLWQRQGEGDWAGGELHASGPLAEQGTRYGFDAAQIEQRMQAAASGQRAQVARWIASWASTRSPHEAWALLTWAELVAAEERQEWPLVRAGLELFAGMELGSPALRRATRLAELSGERARCRALRKLGALFTAPFAFEHTIVATPEDGLAQLAQLVQRAEPGTRIVLEPGRYEEDPSLGPISLRGHRVRIEAREIGSVEIAAPLLIEGSYELVLAGLSLRGTQGYGLQVMRSSCTLENLRIDGGSAGLHFGDSFVWLRGCQLLGRPNATGVLLREGAVGMERCLVDGFQIAVQAQGRAQILLSRCVLSDLAFAVARGNGDGSALYADRCAVLGTARQVFTNFPQGAVARLLLAGVAQPGASLGEGFAVDTGTLLELDGTNAAQWGGAKLQAGVAAWFDAR